MTNAHGLLPTSVWSTQWVRYAQGIFFHSISFKPILILSSYLSLGLPSGILPWSSSSKFLFDSFLPSTRDTCPVPPTLRDVFCLTTNYDVSHYPILSSLLLSLSRFQYFTFRRSRQRSYTFGYRTTLKLQSTIFSVMLVPIYQTVGRYIPEEKFIWTAVRTPYVTKETHFLTTFLLRNTELCLSHSVHSSNKWCQQYVFKYLCYIRPLTARSSLQSSRWLGTETWSISRGHRASPAGLFQWGHPCSAQLLVLIPQQKGYVTAPFRKVDAVVCVVKKKMRMTLS